MVNGHGAQITPVSEDLRRAESMLERERKSGPHAGKARMIAALEARIRTLKKRAEREEK